MNTQLSLTAVAAKPANQITLTEAKTVGVNVAPLSTSGHYAVAGEKTVINEENGQYLLEVVGNNFSLITEKHASVGVQTTSSHVGCFRQDEVNQFTKALEKSAD